MNKELTEIVLLLDKSGSMDSMRNDTIGGYNMFVQANKEAPGKANFTLVTFSDPTVITIVHDGIDIQDVPRMTQSDYVPAGSTALYDALGKTLNNLDKRINDMDEDDRPARVLFVILTDGEENSSKTYKRERIFGMIDYYQSNDDWQFIYLGANQDAMLEGGNMGIRTGNSMSYVADQSGLRSAYMSASVSSVGYRTTGNLSVNNYDTRTGGIDINNTDDSTVTRNVKDFIKKNWVSG